MQIEGNSRREYCMAKSLGRGKKMSRGVTKQKKSLEMCEGGVILFSVLASIIIRDAIALVHTMLGHDVS